MNFREVLKDTPNLTILDCFQQRSLRCVSKGSLAVNCAVSFPFTFIMPLLL